MLICPDVATKYYFTILGDFSILYCKGLANRLTERFSALDEQGN
jgi:hypothetical protein